MKTLEEIKQGAQKGDYSRVAEILQVDASLVQKVINDQRTDHHTIQKTFSDLLESRERLNVKANKRREKKRRRKITASL